MRRRSTRQKRRANWRLRSRVPAEEEEVGSMGGAGVQRGSKVIR